MRPAGGIRRYLVLVLAFAAIAIADTPEAGEYELKAAMLGNVIRLVEWPAPKTGDAAPLLVCVVNSDEMAAAMEKSVSRSPMAGTRRLALRKVNSGAPLDGCDALFFGASDRKKIEAVLHTAAQLVLTVGESDRFTAWGGLVALLIRNDHLEVEVNLVAAQKTGLAISSRLLRIAVIRGGGPS